MCLGMRGNNRTEGLVRSFHNGFPDIRSAPDIPRDGLLTLRQAARPTCGVRDFLIKNEANVGRK